MSPVAEERRWRLHSHTQDLERAHQPRTQVNSHNLLGGEAATRGAS